MADKHGPLVRLWGVDVSSQLPPTSATAEELEPLLKSILGEALPFIESIPSSAPPSAGASLRSDSSRWKAKGVKTFPNSIAPVHLFERTVPAAALASVAQEHSLPASVVEASQVRAETWAARRSVHEDAAARGTASWAEWVRCFKDEHAEAERDFTPTVLSTRVRQQWEGCGGVADVDGWTDWTLKAEESVHRLPAPLRARVFPVVQATAAARGRRDFVVVQIAAVRGGQDDDDDDDGGGTVRGAYTSVERLRETPGGGGIEWTMATASDAAGVVPAWVQRMAVPAQIAKDVDMFLGWIADERDKAAGGGAE